MPGNYLTKAQQFPAELADFIGFIREVAPTSYCEIGCKHGGLLWAVTQAMPRGSRIVGVDLPNGPWGRTDSARSLTECFAVLKQHYDAHLFWGDSTSAMVVDRVRAVSPFDVVFIDANHTEKYVRSDFANYGTLTKICCFHDIAWNQPTPPGRMAIEVPKVWRDLRTKYADIADFREIKRDNGHNGIGILTWRPT